MLPNNVTALIALLSASFFSLGISEKDQPMQTPTYAAVQFTSGDESGLQHPLVKPVDIDQDLLSSTSESQPRSVSFPSTPRHAQEKIDLLDRLKRSKGTWTTNHPRHRLLDALYGFSHYYERQNEELNRLRDLYTRVTKSQHKLLEKTINYSQKFTQIDELLQRNQHLCSRVVENALEYYEIDRAELDKHISHLMADGKKADRIAVSQALKHIVRDWTEGGAEYERNDSFNCLLKTLESLFPERSAEKPVKVLVPGSGLGRLGRDISTKGGFEVTLNEWSMYMNVAYRFLETHAHRTDNEVFHPFIDTWSHHLSSANQQRQIPFPDAPLNSNDVLLVEGDFISVFNTKPRPQYDAIVTFFFIDTARNLASYFDTIKSLLRPGGYWINLGPLLYGSAPFVQLSLEDIVTFVEEGMDFKFLDVAGSECGDLTLPKSFVRGMGATYGFDDLALTKNAYKAQFWVAQRP